MAEYPIHQFMPPGGLQGDIVGQVLAAAATLAPSRMVHHVTGTTQVTTITPPWTDYTGPLYLIADSVFSWTSTGGNIAAPNASTLIALNAYGFLYDRKTGKWYPFGVGL